MTTALIVAGVIVFLAFDAFVILSVLRRHRSQDDYGAFPVPGSSTVMLTEPGRLRVSYQESINAPQDSHGDIDFDVPSALEVSVVSDASGEKVELKGPGIAGTGSSVSGTMKWTRAVVGTAEISEPGSYTVTAGPELPNAVKPRILLGK